MDEFMSFISVSIVSGILLGTYFMPSLVAMRRKHNNEMPITITNLLLGWTLIGWVVALIWSTTNNTKTTA
jgi:hypothetical protein